MAGNDWQKKQNQAQSPPNTPPTPPPASGPTVVHSAHAPQPQTDSGGQPMSKTDLIIAKLAEQVESLQKQLSQIQQGGKAEESPMKAGVVTRQRTFVANRDPDNPKDKNPCACQECTPFKVCHWYCSTCGKGPFKFQKTDPGRGAILRPPFQRQMQRFLTTGHYFDRDGNRQAIQEWVYWARYACSASCASMEQSEVANEQWDLADKRPEMQRAVESVARSMADAEGVPVGAGDDLG